MLFLIHHFQKREDVIKAVILDFNEKAVPVSAFKDKHSNSIKSTNINNKVHGIWLWKTSSENN